MDVNIRNELELKAREYLINADVTKNSMMNLVSFIKETVIQNASKESIHVS